MHVGPDKAAMYVMKIIRMMLFNQLKKTLSIISIRALGWSFPFPQNRKWKYEITHEHSVWAIAQYHCGAKVLLLLIEFQRERQNDECECCVSILMIYAWSLIWLWLSIIWKKFQRWAKYFYCDGIFICILSHSHISERNRQIWTRFGKCLRRKKRREHSKNFNCKTIKRKRVLFFRLHFIQWSNISWHHTWWNLNVCMGNVSGTANLSVSAKF